MIIPMPKLRELCKLITKGTTPSTIGAETTSQGVIYIRSDALNQGRHLDRKCFIYIDENTHEQLRRSQIHENDVLFSMAGALLGKTALVTPQDVPANTNQAVAIIRVCHEKVDYKYVYYYLSQKNIQQYVRSLNAQSAQPNVNLQQIGDIEINIPEDKEMQIWVSSILSSYDDKIENNIRHIDTLDKYIQALYQYWFTEFNYPDATGEIQDGIPVGWTNTNVFYNVTEIREKNKDNLDYPVLSVVKEGTFRPSDDVFTKQVYSKETTNYKIVWRNQVAYNPARANIGSIAMLTDFDAGLVSPIYVVFKMKETVTPTFFYYYMKQPMFLERIKHHAIGTTRQNFPFEAFKLFPMVVPPIELQRRFEEVAKPFEQKIAKLKEENAVLAEIRDALLPKLISGELPVKAGEE